MSDDISSDVSVDAGVEAGGDLENSTQDFIDDLIGFESGDNNTSVIQTEADSQDTSEIDVSTESHTVDVTKVREPVSTEPLTEAEPESDVDILRRQYAEAMAELASLKSGRVPEVEASKQAPATEPVKQPETVLTKAMDELTSVDWLNGVDPAEFFDEPAKLNTLLNQVVTSAIRTAEAMTHERIMKSLPAVIQETSRQQTQVQGIVNEFYTKNADLAPFKQAVSTAAMQIHSESPTKPLETVMSEAAERTRQALRLKGGAPVKPAFPAAGGKGIDRSQKPPTLSNIDRQILDLISD